MKGVELFVFVFMLLLVYGVIAAGSSTGVAGVRGSVDVADAKAVNGVDNFRTNGIGSNVVVDCEDSDDRRSRIKCRLDYIRKNKKEFESSSRVLPEACRKIGDKEGCEKLYLKSEICYEKSGRSKNKCFKRLANFANAKLKDENPSGRSQKARDYVVLLLYDIQEKIEYSVEEGRVDSEKGSSAIEKIVEIKELILNGESKNVVRPLIKELRVILNDIKESVNLEVESDE